MKDKRSPDWHNSQRRIELAKIRITKRFSKENTDGGDRASKGGPAFPVALPINPFEPVEKRLTKPPVPLGVLRGSVVQS